MYPPFPVKAQPADIRLDGLNEFRTLAVRIGVIKPQGTSTLEVPCQAKIQAN